MIKCIIIFLSLLTIISGCGKIEHQTSGTTKHTIEIPEEYIVHTYNRFGLDPAFLDKIEEICANREKEQHECYERFLKLTLQYNRGIK